MKHILIATAAAAAVLLSACSENTSQTRDVTTQNGTTTVEATMNGDTTLSVTISDAYIMAPLKGRDVAAGYFVVENTGAMARLVSASTPLAETVELHTHSMEGGVMKMREVEAVDLPENETVTFEPGGLHLMMFGFNRTEGQAETPVTLSFEGGEEMTLSVPIRERN